MQCPGSGGRIYPIGFGGVLCEKALNETDVESTGCHGGRMILRFLRLACLELFDELGNDGIEVSDDADIRDFENRCGRILVDRDDRIGGLHAGEVLDSAGDADGDVEFRANRLTGLADLVQVGNPACVDGCAGSADACVEFLCESPDHVEFFGASETAAAGNDDFGFGEVDVGAALGDGLDALHAARHGGKVDRNGNDFALFVIGDTVFLEDIGADGRHLRTMIGAGDGRHDIAAESGACLEQVALFGIEVELRAVGRQARVEDGSDGRREGATDCRGAEEDGLGSEIADGLAESGGLVIVLVVGELRGVQGIDLLGAVVEQFLCEGCTVFGEDDGGQRVAALFGQFRTFGEEFVDDGLHFAIALFGENPNFFIAHNEIERKENESGLDEVAFGEAVNELLDLLGGFSLERFAIGLDGRRENLRHAGR